MEKRITTPLTLEQVKDLKCGDSVLISGVIYTARDAAHKRLCELVAQGKELPFDPKDAVIYYVGPAPAKGDQVIGSAGPTTSYRMDAYSTFLYVFCFSYIYGIFPVISFAEQKIYSSLLYIVSIACRYLNPWNFDSFTIPI